ncbi:MAG: hypothetical protein WBO46_10810 [Caldilineaceae bacterium]
MQWLFWINEFAGNCDAEYSAFFWNAVERNAAPMSLCDRNLLSSKTAWSGQRKSRAAMPQIGFFSSFAILLHNGGPDIEMNHTISGGKTKAAPTGVDPSLGMSRVTFVPKHVPLPILG